MARLYANEHFPRAVVEILRSLGHDILTVQEAGKANHKIPDLQVLEFATQEERAILTLNRTDFLKLHYNHPDHSGIIICRDDRNWENFANRIHQVITQVESFKGQLIRVNRVISS
jgi:predicted nuclease of predicted toxin-antitoxin system